MEIPKFSSDRLSSAWLILPSPSRSNVPNTRLSSAGSICICPPPVLSTVDTQNGDWKGFSRFITISVRQNWRNFWFIQWGACCCSGGNRDIVVGIKVKDENGVDKQFIEQCKDHWFKHPVRTSACKRLAKLPPVISLYSGIHGDVVISKQSRWRNSSDYESNGTQVLIPVACSLIEFFSSKHVQKDQKFIDYVSALFKQENTMKKAEEQLCEPPANDILKSLPLSLHYLNFVPKTYQPNNYSSFEGSSTCSSLSNELQVLKLGPPNTSPEKQSEQHFDSPNTNLTLKRKNYTDCAFPQVGAKSRQNAERGPYKSKNLVTERNRRKRIKAGMFALRALVPKISKMDRASTLGDAADYIEELQKIRDNYHDELGAMEKEEYNKVNAKPDLPTDQKKMNASENTPIEVQVEVSQVGTKDFLLKLVYKQKKGGFSRLLECLYSLGLQVIDANVSTFNGSVLNVLKVEADNKTVVEPKTLKRSLIQLVK